jgi:hypothetical protein
MPALLVEHDTDVQLWNDDGGGATLDDLLSGAWERLATGSSASCPVCSGELQPRWSAGAGIVGGRCGSCASELR